MSVLVGCTGPTTHPTASGSMSGHGTSPAPIPKRTSVFPSLVLRADLGERPATWERVMFIGFGGRREQLGYRTFPEGPASQPSAFAVAPDGSIWIDDRWKRRVVHYSASGDFLWAGRMDHPGWDVAIVDGRVYLLVDQMTGTIGIVEPGGVTHVDVTYRGDPLFTFQLIPTAVGLVAQATGVRGPEEGELGTFVVLHPPHAVAGEPLPGLPLGDGEVSLDARFSEDPAHPGGDQDFDLTFSSPDMSQTQPIQFDLIGHDGAEETSIPAEVGLREPLTVGDDVLIYVQIAPTRPDDAERYGGGHWLLRIGRSPILWERVPDPAISSELQHRHFAVGPDGSIYLMVAYPSGVAVLRRPATVP
jgi:hypothetical protein